MNPATNTTFTLGKVPIQTTRYVDFILLIIVLYTFIHRFKIEKYFHNDCNMVNPTIGSKMCQNIVVKHYVMC